LVISYFRSFELPVKIVRPFNTYGPRQSARAIIPTVVSQMLSGKKEIELGSLTPTRDLTYVLDTCKGFLDIYNSEYFFGEVINIGMNKEISIGSLVKTIGSLMGDDFLIKSSNERIRPNNSEVDRLICDNSKLLNQTSWSPEFTLEQGINEVIDWMKLKDNMHMFKSQIYNV